MSGTDSANAARCIERLEPTAKECFDALFKLVAELAVEVAQPVNTERFSKSPETRGQHPEGTQSKQRLFLNYPRAITHAYCARKGTLSNKRRLFNCNLSQNEKIRMGCQRTLFAFFYREWRFLTSSRAWWIPIGQF